MLLIISLFILGLFLIVKGGDIFVDSAVLVSKATGLPEIFIGATIVSIATTLPELTVSSTAALKGFTTMSIGNSIGSIICNTGLILGVVNIFSPSKIKGRVFISKAVVLIVCTAILFLMSQDRSIGKGDSLILVALLIGYLALDTLILKYKKDAGSMSRSVKLSRNEKVKTIINFLLGIVMIIAGSNLLINNGVKLAEYIGVPESVISLTMIALGTSLPELVASITAMVKGYAGLSVGNILGANILNIVMVLGISSTITPLRMLKQNLVLDLPVAFILIMILILPTLKFKKVTRLQGILLLLTYLTYLALLYNLYI